MDVQSPEDLAARIAALLVRTAEAHREYEIDALQGNNDDDWPFWYAAYLRQHGLRELLEAQPGRDAVINNLQQHLIQADQSFQASGATGDWPTYYAAYFLRLGGLSAADSGI